MKLLSGVLYIITYSIKTFLLLDTIYTHSSLSVSFLITAESVSGSIYGIIRFIGDEENRNKTLNITISSLEILSIIFIVLATMVYEEIIVIEICGLGKNVVDANFKRGDDEYDNSRYQLTKSGANEGEE